MNVLRSLTPRLLPQRTFSMLPDVGLVGWCKIVLRPQLLSNRKYLSRCVSGFLRQDEVLKHAFFHRAPANVLDALADIVTDDHVIEQWVTALGTSTHLP